MAIYYRARILAVVLADRKTRRRESDGERKEMSALSWNGKFQPSIQQSTRGICSARNTRDVCPWSACSLCFDASSRLARREYRLCIIVHRIIFLSTSSFLSASPRQNICAAKEFCRAISRETSGEHLMTIFEQPVGGKEDGSVSDIS